MCIVYLEHAIQWWHVRFTEHIDTLLFSIKHPLEIGLHRYGTSHHVSVWHCEVWTIYWIFKIHVYNVISGI